MFSGVAAQAGMVAHDSDDVVSPCEPSRPVNVLQYHGTADEVILYDGGATLTQPFPSAVESVVRCSPAATSGANALFRDRSSLPACARSAPSGLGPLTAEACRSYGGPASRQKVGWLCCEMSFGERIQRLALRCIARYFASILAQAPQSGRHGKKQGDCVFSGLVLKGLREKLTFLHQAQTMQSAL